MLATKPVFLVEIGQDETPAAAEVLSELGVVEHLIRKSGADEALAQLRANRTARPAVLLLDGFQPDSDGLSLLRTLKSDERLKSIPVIVLTTTADKWAVDECYRIGVAGYIVKSSNRQDLVDALKAMHQYWTLSELPLCR